MGLWFVNPESISWSHEPKMCKISIFHKSFFPKYDNFKIINVGDISLSICLELQWMRLIDERKKFCPMFWLDLN